MTRIFRDENKYPYFNPIDTPMFENGEVRKVCTYDVYMPTNTYIDGKGYVYIYAGTKVMPEIYYHDIQIGPDMMDDMIDRIIEQIILPKLGNDIISGDMLRLTDGAREIRVKVNHSIDCLFRDEYIVINYK